MPVLLPSLFHEDDVVRRQRVVVEAGRRDPEAVAPLRTERLPAVPRLSPARPIRREIDQFLADVSHGLPGRASAMRRAGSGPAR